MPEEGQSAVVVPVSAVEPVVSSWRDRFDSSAADGMPAHITALFPFLPESRLTQDALAELRALCDQVVVFEVTFLRVGRFPGVLYLDPDPPDALRALTRAIAERWPETPPYGGRHDDVVPHLTVACADDATLDGVEAELTPRLPLTAVLAAARLYVFDGIAWQLRQEFAFRGSAAGDSRTAPGG